MFFFAKTATGLTVLAAHPAIWVILILGMCYTAHRWTKRAIRGVNVRILNMRDREIVQEAIIAFFEDAATGQDANALAKREILCEALTGSPVMKQTVEETLPDFASGKLKEVIDKAQNEVMQTASLVKTNLSREMRDNQEALQKTFADFSQQLELANITAQQTLDGIGPATELQIKNFLGKLENLLKEKEEKIAASLAVEIQKAQEILEEILKNARNEMRENEGKRVEVFNAERQKLYEEYERRFADLQRTIENLRRQVEGHGHAKNGEPNPAVTPPKTKK